ncbi:hypothetical protein ABKV19_022811 [Rosa sericea]
MLRATRRPPPSLSRHLFLSSSLAASPPKPPPQIHTHTRVSASLKPDTALTSSPMTPSPPLFPADPGPSPPPISSSGPGLLLQSIRAVSRSPLLSRAPARPPSRRAACSRLSSSGRCSASEFFPFAFAVVDSENHVNLSTEASIDQEIIRPTKKC